MNVEALLADFARRGIRLEPDGNALIARPRQLLTDADRATIRSHGPELLAYLHQEQVEQEIDRLAAGDGWRPLPPAGAPAYSIVETCRCYGVALRIDGDGCLVVGKAGAKAEQPTQPWQTLLIALRAHAEAVARLIESGWHLRADFPKGAAA